MNELFTYSGYAEKRRIISSRLPLAEAIDLVLAGTVAITVLGHVEE